MTIFDRYLLRRYWHVFTIGFVALFGLYFVIDVFTNVTDFLDQPGSVTGRMAEMARYYGYRASYFLGLAGGTLEVISAMVALALVQKHGELNPILSAGISTYRLMRPLLAGAVAVNLLIVLNQELVIPRISLELQRNAGSQSDVAGDVEPVTDFATELLITGKRLNLRRQSIEEAEFVLRPPKAVSVLTGLSAREAVPIAAGKGRRAGWLLKGTKLRYESLPLTELGRKLVRPGEAPDEIFVRTDVGFDRLYNRDRNFEFLSTRELMRRIRNPSFSHRSIRSQSLYLHERFTKPILNLIVVAVGVPFVVRRESTSLLKNLAICGFVLGAMFGCNELAVYLGRSGLISAELAVWLPIIFWGTAAAWFMGLVRT